uniref:Metalloendopeptidase n=1 Tax=Strongyloides venezuelensis TaxID=75913 RepID=A0A0K0FBQ7_STRVS
MNKISFIFILSILCIYKSLKITSKKQFWKKLPELKPRFSNIIYFYTDNSESYLRKIEKKLQFFSGHVCIKFVKNETMITGKGINFLSTTNDSDIQLNTDLNKPTNIYINVLDPNKEQQVPFFIGMALGLIPEITRYDRDKYVKVNLTNVKPSHMKYYKKESKKKNYFGSYDYGSLMAIDNLFGSKNNKPTYTFNLYSYYHPPYNTYYYFITSFTHNDFRRLNFMYCKNYCPNLRGCSNRGFPNSNCLSCSCGGKDHFIYPDCHLSPAHTDPSCGIKTLYKSYGRKSYLKRKNVTGECYYRIKSSNGRKVAITIRSLELGYVGKLDIYYRKDKAVSPLTLNNINSNFQIPPSYKEVYLIFHSMLQPTNFSIMYHNTKNN